MPDYLTPPVVAELLGVTIESLANRRAEGIRPAFVKEGHFVRYPKAEITLFLAQRAERDRLSALLSERLVQA